ncbi:MAG: hypothetical protein ACF8K1_05350 [Phycisphaerales bacterium JB047]
MKSAIIVGCGPSLDTSLIPSYHEAADWVVTVNRGFRAWDDYPNLDPCQLYLCDGPNAFKDCLNELIAYAQRTPLFVPKPTVPDKIPYKERWEKLGAKTVHDLKLSRDKTIEKNPFQKGAIAQPIKSLLFAWQILVRAGFDSIGIAGVDLRCDPKQRYFHDWPELTPGQQGTQCRSYGVQKECFRHWIPYAEDLGVKTFNLGPETSGLAKVMETLTLGQFVRSNSVVDNYREDENT